MLRGESFVVERFWESRAGRNERGGGDTLGPRISEPRLGMGERVFYYIVGLVTHSRNWQREGATRGRSSSTLGELCDPLGPQLCAIVLICALCELCALVAIKGTLQPL